ncbi:MAG: type II toxin-antitoxin system RelB/DinJ family antitoxin [Clostridiales bacterium]|jgi:DNA-damage-inducible protein J|nr:type II toxin-antitoxin system RelB/DinJ family antitoxin [Clostridiales bacterium]
MNDSNAKKLDTIKVNSKLKAEAEEILKQMGLTSAQAVNVFFAKVINTNNLPFDIRNKETKKNNDYFAAMLKEAENAEANGAEWFEGFALLDEFDKEFQNDGE